jgi:hypothetical protein
VRIRRLAGRDFRNADEIPAQRESQPEALNSGMAKYSLHAAAFQESTAGDQGYFAQP